MQTSEETSDLAIMEIEATKFETVQLADFEPPRELLRDVAANLKSLAKVIPYAEYAAIVRRIAQLRLRCECAVEASASSPSHSDLPNADGAA